MLNVFRVCSDDSPTTEEEIDGDGLRRRETEEICVPLEKTVAVFVEGENRADELVRCRIRG